LKTGNFGAGPAPRPLKTGLGPKISGKQRNNFCVSKKWLRHFFEKGDRAEFGPQSTFSAYMPPKKYLKFIFAFGENSCGGLF
jgi:hypothetical protein